MLDPALSFERLDRVLFPVPSGRVHGFDVQADVAGRRFRRELPRAALLGRLDNRPPARTRRLRLRLTTDACDRPVVEQYRPRRPLELRLPLLGRLDNRPPARTGAFDSASPRTRAIAPSSSSTRPRRRHDLRPLIRGRRPEEVHRVYPAGNSAPVGPIASIGRSTA